MYRPLAILTCCATIAVPLAAREGNGKYKEKREHHEARGAGRADIGVRIFLGGDQRIIREYIGGHHGRGLPPGLAKRNGALPPGLAKQLRRNGRLPPGLEKRLYPFPPDLERRLSPLAPGLRRGFIDGRAVIYNGRTSVILDVFLPL